MFVKINGFVKILLVSPILKDYLKKNLKEMLNEFHLNYDKNNKEDREKYIFTAFFSKFA